MEIIKLGKFAFWLMICLLGATICGKAAHVALDYDGDRRTDLAVVRYDQNTTSFVWYILQSRDGFRANVWGLQSNDRPRFEGDYDGDGKTDLAVTRLMPNDPYLYWYILNSSDGTMTVMQ